MGDLRGLPQHDDRRFEWAVPLIDWLFSQGHAADIILAVLAAELIGLVTIGGWRWPAALFRLLPGALMIVALRGALTDADWYWIALPLALSFPVHLADVRRRG